MAAGLHMKAVYWRTPSIGVEDVAVTTHDFWRDPDPDTAYADAVATAFTTFFTGCGVVIASQCVLKELRFYFGYDGDGSPGELDYLKSYSLAGTGGNGMLPPQCACSVTEIVGAGSTGRKRWGRFYLPGIDKGATDANGRLTSGAVNLVANAAEVMYDSLRDGTNGAIVWTIVQGGPSRAYVDSIRVDDVVDIQRRRRWDSALIRVTKPIE